MLDTKEIRESTKKLLQENGIEFNYNLPFLDLPQNIRNKDEIAGRINILHILYAVYLNGSKSRSFYYSIIQKEKIEIYLTPKEKKSLTNFWGINKQELINLSWKKESILALLWVCQITKPDFIYNYKKEGDISDYYSQIPPDVTLDEFSENIQLLDMEDILKAIDLYYVLHWLASHDMLN